MRRVIRVAGVGCIGLALLHCSLLVSTGDLATSSLPDAASDAAAAGVDGGVAPDGDAAPPSGCTDEMPFTRVSRLDELSGPTREGSPHLLPDELTIYFQRAKTLDPTRFDFDILVAKRASRSLPFDPPTIVSEVSTTSDENSPAITEDGLVLYFGSNRDDDAGRFHLYRTGRNTVADPFGAARAIVATLGDGTALENNPAIDRSNAQLIYATNRGTDGGFALWSAPIVGQIVQTPSPLDLPTPAVSPVLTSDGLTLYFSLALQVVHSQRLADGGFGAPTPTAGLSSSTADRPGWISPDRCRLYFGRNANADNTDLFVAERTP